MLHTEEIKYTQKKDNFHGFAAYSKESNQPKPCIIIAHDWSGRTQAFCDKAKQLAQLGFVGFAADVYGDGKTAATTEEKKALLNPLLEKRYLIGERMLAALEKVTSLPYVNPQKIAAIGYCFGGLCVLDLARAGADIKGVISFHGLLHAPEQNHCKQIKSKVLVLHGYEDPLAPKEQMIQFANEMTQKKVDWQINLYGNTQHAFTNPDAHDDEMGLNFNATADKRSWESALAFLKENFA